MSKLNRPAEATNQEPCATVNTGQKQVCPLYVLNDNTILDDKLWPCIPEGDYHVAFIGYETKKTFSVPKVYAHFKIIEPGSYFGKVLYRAFNAKALTGKTGKNGKYTVGKRSELFITLCRLYENMGKPFRMDRVSLTGMRHAVILASVRTVTKDYRQRLLPECMRYSVIGELKNVEAGKCL